MEVAPILVGVPILVAPWRAFPLSPLPYRLLFVHACVLMLGAHDSYAEVPLGLWVRDALRVARKPWDVERLRRFAATCGPGPVLDVGCGAAGHVGRFLADLGARVIGVDFSERSVVHASRLNPTLRFVAGDMRALPFVPGACAGI